MKKIFVLIALVLGSIPAVSMAEGGCPQGYYPQTGVGWQGCAPGPNINGDAAPPRIVMDGYWETTWGALASSSAVEGSAVSVTGQSSKERAKKVALDACKKRGGAQDCLVHYTYYNGCVAVADSSTKFGFMSFGQDEEKASRLALEQCANAGTGKCTIVLTDCSKPIYHKY